MDDQVGNGGNIGDGKLPSVGKSSRRKLRRNGRQSESAVRSVNVQVTVQVPRDVMAVFDGFSDVSGVNRQHLIREALTAYATLLDGGCRIYQVPGISQERAA